MYTVQDINLENWVIKCSWDYPTRPKKTAKLNELSVLILDTFREKLLTRDNYENYSQLLTLVWAELANQNGAS